MTRVYYSASSQSTDEITLEDGESVLNGLLRAGHSIPYGCQAGVCQSCLMVSDDPIPASAQTGLSDAQKAQGYFLSCCCTPSDDLNVSELSDSASSIDATVIDKIPLNEKIIRLRLKPEEAFTYQPGQFVTLANEHGEARSYSLASHPDDSFLEFHIKRIEQGVMSRWLSDQLEQGDTLKIQGPKGLCFYTANNLEQPLLLCAMGTGLAPIVGILRDALKQGHKGPITLVTGSQYASDLYLMDQLYSLADLSQNLKVYYVAQEIDLEDSKAEKADIYQTVRDLVPKTTGHRVFLCGGESFVKKMKRQAFMAGANMGDISADPFIATGKPVATVEELEASNA